MVRAIDFHVIDTPGAPLVSPLLVNTDSESEGLLYFTELAVITDPDATNPYVQLFAKVASTGGTWRYRGSSGTPSQEGMRFVGEYADGHMQDIQDCLRAGILTLICTGR